MANLDQTMPLPAKTSTRTASIPWSALAMIPYLGYALLFLVLPIGLLMAGAFRTRNGSFTLENLAAVIANEKILGAFRFSLEVSAASALLGAFFGFFIAYSIVLGGLPERIRSPIMTFCGVASNFAGVPLAFAFTATIGPSGLVATFFRNSLGININTGGIILYQWYGLVIVYLYFQIPLMVLVFVPALEGLKREWREATAVLGGTTYHYWRYVALPVLWPSILGATLLLFANAFGAVATAYSLSTQFDIIPIQLLAQITGDVFNNPNLGYAIAFGMVVVTCISSGAYIWLRNRGERWLR